MVAISWKGKNMKILVACEESQAVTIELRKLGHEAYSCDIIECSGGHPEWHIKQDVLTLLNPDWIHRYSDEPAALGFEFFTENGKLHFIPGKWDMIVAFPPCTHLAVSGARWFPQKRKDGRQQRAIEFFCQFLNADCDKIAIENPIGIISGEYIPTHFPRLAETYGLPIKPTQIISPWQFGDAAEKQTCLWLKGLPPLVPTVTDKPQFDYWVSPDGTKRMEKWMYNIRCKSSKNGERAKLASKTFPGIARAMAEAWGKR